MTVAYTGRVTDDGGAGELSAAVKRALAAAATNAAQRISGGSGPAADERQDDLNRIAAAVLVLAGGVGRSSGALEKYPKLWVDTLRQEFIACVAADAQKRITAKELVAVLGAIEDLCSPAERTSGVARAMSLDGMVEIAHDMRSPLAAILLLVEPLRRAQHGPITPLQERQLGLIYGAALSLSTLANDVIDAARRGVTGAPGKHPFSVTATIQDACSVVSPIAEEKQLELRQIYPKLDGRVGDGAALHRVLLNLTSNALKYTHQGGVTVGCTERDASRVEFWVNDTGRGIPAHILDSLFSEFRPVADGSRFSSSGLGLAICKRLVAAMGGEIQVETAPDKGTRFSFTIDLPPA
ncbi:MAG TPA: HAMP domain-containing sensor histidine kinase [Gemmatimonadaceae bacterium]|nr:HAMP domain-containing sensor histidine kinase [Gemmatimonadaceae bacterium]